MDDMLFQHSLATLYWCENLFSLYDSVSYYATLRIENMEHYGICLNY